MAIRVELREVYVTSDNVEFEDKEDAELYEKLKNISHPLTLEELENKDFIPAPERKEAWKSLGRCPHCGTKDDFEEDYLDDDVFSCVCNCCGGVFETYNGGSYEINE